MHYADVENILFIKNLHGLKNFNNAPTQSLMHITEMNKIKELRDGMKRTKDNAGSI